MNIIVGHGQMDLDSLGSLVLASLLFPEYRAVRNKYCNPTARCVYDKYESTLNFLKLKELKGKKIDKMIVVDTRKNERIKEIYDVIDGAVEQVEVYDHHKGVECDIPGAIEYFDDTGANTSILALEAKGKKIKIPPELATIALAGIYADTGRFTYNNLTIKDFEASAYLLECGADNQLADKYLTLTSEDKTDKLIQKISKQVEKRDIFGDIIAFFCEELPEQQSGLNYVVEQVFKLEKKADAIYGFFSFKKGKDVLIISRSR
ncbi:MAG: DHH family phosphoesterase, partial [Spirochaetaceae bacterium]|nr:DHH family phosphoesterase [Spirochaetaceae bacterium]